MDVIAAGIAEMMLHVADDRVLPLQEINRAVGANFDVGWPEIGIIGLDERLDFGANETGICVRDFVLQDTEKTDDVWDEQIALH